MIQLHRTQVIVMTILLLAGCRVYQKQGITEPTSSELSGIKDKFYQLLMVPYNDSAARLHFVTCPNLESEFDSTITPYENVKHLCVPAFVNEQGYSVTFLASTVENSNLFASNQSSVAGYESLLHAANRYRLTTVASGTLGTVMVLTNFKLSKLPVLIAAPVLFGSSAALGETMRMKNTEQAQKCVLALRNIRESSGNSSLAPSTLEAFEALKKAISNDCKELLSHLWIDHSPHLDLVDSFQELINTNTVYVKSVSSRVPRLLPILGKFLMDIRWSSQAVTHHCLPKTNTLESLESEEVTPLCIPLRRSWNTGNQYWYKKPTDAKDDKHIK